ncbi:MAG: hypothetical protein DSY80_06920 [Desulfocapsa sp.]|nr:MAG: hypothetical protein DSY80_06920 [Desulfocapsa sp.]
MVRLIAEIANKFHWNVTDLKNMNVDELLVWHAEVVRIVQLENESSR